MTDTNITASTGAAVEEKPSLEQRIVKIQFYIQNMAQSAIIIGQELTECKKEVPHGEWARAC